MPLTLTVHPVHMRSLTSMSSRYTVHPVHMRSLTSMSSRYTVHPVHPVHPVHKKASDYLAGFFVCAA